MKSIVVTGGAGFIGSCLVRRLVAAGQWNVATIDALTYASTLDALATVANSPQHTFVQGDVCDAKQVRQLLVRHRPEAIVHLAAETHVDRSIQGPAKFLQTNVGGTFVLLEEALRYWQQLSGAARALFRFVHVSTDEVYGSLGPRGRFREDSPFAPNSPYAASKAAADHFVRSFVQTYGLPAVITRASNNYGPYQYPEKLIPLTIWRALRGEAIGVYGDGLHVRDWLHVEDHAEALLAVLEGAAGGTVFNIGASCEQTNLDVVETICDAVELIRGREAGRPLRALIRLGDDRPGHDRRYAVDASRLRSQLGWEPTRTFSQTIVPIVRWYCDHTSWMEDVLSERRR